MQVEDRAKVLAVCSALTDPINAYFNKYLALYVIYINNSNLHNCNIQTGQEL